ncbi:Protein CBG19729 [Caenorhabditis briggsae]|uniref:Protein CBG19729 n=1 Tax=Caenorhabditis briggsae TaxID=6238 RepID=A8XWG5_CAEBR|nr:Protein CBG19729 [Caenorhabditis briggsae]CAP36984.1 Protein CBG19729 [Caenorhabditis briggsae]
MKWVTVETICLLFSVLIGFVLNVLAVFLPYWIVETNYNIRALTYSVGIIPFHFAYEAPFHIATSVMMLTAFVLYVFLVGFLVFALISCLVQKYKLCKTGYLLVGILSAIVAILQISSFIAMQIGMKMYIASIYYQQPQLGGCVYLTLSSGILCLISVLLAIILSKTKLA